jgi:hypothetical protein
MGHIETTVTRTQETMSQDLQKFKRHELQTLKRQELQINKLNLLLLIELEKTCNV